MQVHAAVQLVVQVPVGARLPLLPLLLLVRLFRALFLASLPVCVNDVVFRRRDVFFSGGGFTARFAFARCSRRLKYEQSYDVKYKAQAATTEGDRAA